MCFDRPLNGLIILCVYCYSFSCKLNIRRNLGVGNCNKATSIERYIIGGTLVVHQSDCQLEIVVSEVCGWERIIYQVKSSARLGYTWILTVY